MTGARHDPADPAPPCAAVSDSVPRSAATPRLLPEVAIAGLDRLAAIAARVLGAESAQVSLLADRQTIAGWAGPGLSAAGTEGQLADSLCAVTARTGRPLVVHDATHDERVRDLPPVTSGAIGSYLGVPLRDAEGHVLGAFCVCNRQPRQWQPADTTLLSDLAAAVVAELELTALTAEHATVRLRLGLAVDAAGIGTFDLDVVTGEISCDQRLLELLGHTSTPTERTVESFLVHVHPDDAPRVIAGLNHVIDAGLGLDLDYRVEVAGQTRWVSARGRPLLDESGRTVRALGVAYDTTGAHDSATRVARVLETMPAAFASLDRQWRVTHVNTEAEKLLGRTRSELLGHDVWELFPEIVGSHIEKAYREAMRTGLPSKFEAYYPPPLDRWYEVRAWPGPDGLSLYFHDGTERRRALEQADRDRKEAQAAVARIDLLAEVSTLFATELDSELAVGRLARLLVPALVDWCLVSVLDDRKDLRDIGSWHADPAMRGVVEEYSRHRLAALTEQSYVMQAVLTGQMAVIPAPAAAAIRLLLRPGPARDLITVLNPVHAIVLPLVARGRTLGAITLFSGAERGPMHLLDFASASEVARRAGLGLDNSRLYRQQRTLAEALQRSMLTAPPTRADMDIAVRYVPAAEESQVGGDWYDAFLPPDGTTVLTIGDVVGHDTASAAAMGQLRGLLRGIAYTTGDSPAAVLTRLDRAVAGLQIDTTASVVVARIGTDAGGVTTMRWANAGHPPPMVLDPDGTVAVLAGLNPDLLLGIDPAAPRTQWEVALADGATVLLYTDGLVERRTEDLDAGLARLRDTLGTLAGRTLEQLCDEVLIRMRPETPDDDVALVAIRLRS